MGKPILPGHLNTPYGQQDWQEIDWLLGVIRGARSVLEIGSCFGQSLLHFAKVVAPGALIRSIDIGVLPAEATPFDGADITPYLQHAIGHLRGRGFDAEVLIGSSQSYGALTWAWEWAPYDFVFIDGDHTYDGVKADWRIYGAMGWKVGFHDIAHPDCGVARLWSEIKANGKATKECVRSTMGIGVVEHAPRLEEAVNVHQDAA